jgi:tRNA G18 (ribose-2'-O)-methylase SpoU
MGETRVVLRQQLATETRIPDEENDAKAKNLAVLLDNIRSAWNVGSILRSADGFGFSHAYLCGITPTADNESVSKTALGAEGSVAWSYHKDAVKLAQGLKIEGWKVYGLEDDPRAISIDDALSTASPGSFDASAAGEVLIVGNEVTGVDPDLLDLCDQIFHIPMHGEKKSFNVAIAFGIVAYGLRAQKATSRKESGSP